jgi:hypothetical protein
MFDDIKLFDELRDRVRDLVTKLLPQSRYDGEQADAVSWCAGERVACLSLVFWPRTTDACMLISIGPRGTSNLTYLPVIEARAEYVAWLIVGGLTNCP